MKREFPVFGFIEDHLITGIIDQIAYEPERQIEQRPMDAFVNLKPKPRKLIISDVKTRVHSSLPGASRIRSAEIQLSLYHLLLSHLINDQVDVAHLYTLMELDPDAALSDGFLAELGTSFVQAEVIDFETLLKNNTLNVINR
jgi:exonuclease V